MPSMTSAEYRDYLARRAKRPRNDLTYSTLTPTPENAPTDAQRTPTAILCAKSTDEAKLNKTEAAFLAYLRIRGHDWIGVQNITLKIADDTRYTPDFWSADVDRLCAYEVKGFWRDDAKVKIKVAARLFPWIRFVVVQKVKSGWQFNEVKP